MARKNKRRERKAAPVAVYQFCSDCGVPVLATNKVCDDCLRRALYMPPSVQRELLLQEQRERLLPIVEAQSPLALRGS